MKISEVFLLESFFDELEMAIRDRLAQMVGQDIADIPTEEFRKALASDGFLLSVDELKSTLEKLDVVSSVDDNSITPKGNIDNDFVDDETQQDSEELVGNIAGDQAMTSVKDNLPS